MGLKVSSSQMSRHFTRVERPAAITEAKKEDESAEEESGEASDNDVQIARYLSATAERLANLSDRPTSFEITTTIKRIDGQIATVKSIVRPLGE